MADPFIGEIIMFAGNFAPRGWALCDGQLLSIAQNSALFSILGTTYGGDGRTTFGLPDLRGRVAVHEGTGPGLPNIRLGQKGGAVNHTLTQGQLPPHTHTVACSGGAADSDTPVGNFPAVDEGETEFWSSQGGQTMSAGMIAGGGNSQNFGYYAAVSSGEFHHRSGGNFPVAELMGRMPDTWVEG